jgi:hypothetical protein
MSMTETPQSSSDMPDPCRSARWKARPDGWRSIWLRVLCAASFLLYAYGALALHQDRRPGWALEAAGPIPAAVSYLAFGAPLGAVDNNVMEKFIYRDGTPIADLLAQAARHSIAPGAVHATTLDGIGAGSNLFTTLAMAMFGFRLSSLVILYLVTVGISVFAFVLRYHDRRLLVVPLYCLVVTAMLLTPVGTSAAAIDQAPIGGQRYFVLAALIPALHMFFEIIDDHAVARAWRRHGERILLFVQALLLFGALLVRSSTGYLLGVLLIVWLWKLYRSWSQNNDLRNLLYKSFSVGNALALWMVFVVLALPAYVNTGRVFGNVWHRAFISFSLHPDWPFGNLQTVYDCTKYLPKGLSSSNWDQRGHCVWLSSPSFVNKPPNPEGIYGGGYEKILRNAYFYVLAHYPRQVFELYYRIKSIMIADTLKAAVAYLFQTPYSPVPTTLFVVLIAQLFVFAAFLISVSIIDPPIIDIRTWILPVFFLSSLAPQYVAAASLPTSVDVICLMYCCLIFGVLAVMQSAVCLWRVMRKGPLSPTGACSVVLESTKLDQG